MNKKYILIFLVLTLSAYSFKKEKDQQYETKTGSEIVNQISEVENNISSESKAVKITILNEENQSWIINEVKGSTMKEKKKADAL